MSYLSMVKIRDLLDHYKPRKYSKDGDSRHKMVMSLFEDNLGTNPRSNSGILFRLENGSGGSRCLVRSSIAPKQISGLVTMEEPELQPFKHFAFRVTANPIIRGKAGERPILDDLEREDWLVEKLSQAFSNIQIIDQKSEVILRSKAKRSFLQLVQFDGIAELKDLDKLKELIDNGVGRNKSYGAGLLTVKAVG